MSDRVAFVETLLDRYNAQDADGYAAMFVEEGSEASYRGAALREGREGVREGLRAMFAQFPENRAEIVERHALGDHVVLRERVWRAKDAEPFDVLAIYSFRDDLVERVEFIR